MSKPYTDDALLRAADAVRAFEKSDGMAVFLANLNTVRQEAHSVLYTRTANVSHAQYAEAGGVARTCDRVIEIFKQIKLEAERLNTNE